MPKIVASEIHSIKKQEQHKGSYTLIYLHPVSVSVGLPSVRLYVCLCLSLSLSMYLSVDRSIDRCLTRSNELPNIFTFHFRRKPTTELFDSA